MAHLTADPFAAMIEPGLFAQAMAESLQLSQLPKRQYSPLSGPSRAEGAERSDIDDDEAEAQDGAGRSVANTASVPAPPLHGCWLGGVDAADRFDFVDTGPGGLIAVDPVRRVG